MERTFIERIDRLRRALVDAGIGARWVEPSFDLFYLTGLAPLSMERIFGLIVLADGSTRMVVPKLLADEASEVADCEFFAWDDTEGPEGALKGALDGLTTLHVAPTLPIGAVNTIRGPRNLDIQLEEELLADLRSRKDASEAEALRRASLVTDEMVEWVASQNLVGISERELALRVAMRYMSQGHRPWEDLLVAYGPNAAMPHYTGGDTQIGSDRPLLIDIGAAVGGYQSDTTRVLFPDAVAAEVGSAYEVVVAAAQAALEVVEAGVPAQEVDRAARKVISEAGYGELFIHRTGHGVGLDIHEAPYIREGNHEPLEEGNVFSIEPGIYSPGRFGLRYENLVYLGPEGAELLNHTPAHHRLG